jgi:hypothetical protein
VPDLIAALFDPTTTATASASASPARSTTRARTRSAPTWTVSIPSAPAAPTSPASAARKSAATVTVTGSWPYRGTVPQTRILARSHTRGSVFFGLEGA